MKRCALYVRVSTAEQRDHGLSVDSQITALKDYCKKNDLIITDIYNDAGLSARKRYTKRPELLRLVSDCEAGKVDLILFTKLDRWFRSVSDYYEVQSLLDKLNVHWRAIWEDYETETSAGVFKVNIMLSIAQAESDRTSERVKAVNDYRRAKGCYVGKAPLGYKIVNSQLLIDEDKKEAVKHFFDVFHTTGSTVAARDALAEHGVTIRRSAVKNLLKNTAYYGEASGYKCEPYISKEQYEKNYEMVKRRAGSNAKKGRTYIFAGITRCQKCGGIMSGCASNGKGKSDYKWYRCTNHLEYGTCDETRTYHEKKIERKLVSMLDDVIGEYRVSAQLTEKKNKNDDKKKRLEARLERISIMFEDGDISLKEYREKRDKLKADIASIPTTERASIPSLPDNWKDIYWMLEEVNKKSFWAQVIKTMYLSKNGRDYVITIDFL